MRPAMTRLTLAGLLAVALSSAPVAADVIILKNGDKIEGDVAENGDRYDVKTKYGLQAVPKADVKKIVKSARQMTDEADGLLKKGRGIYDDAVQNESNLEERNRKLNSAIEVLDRAMKIYNEAREIFPGPEGAYIEDATKSVIQESRKCRYKLTREEDLHKAPEAANVEPKKEIPPAPGPAEVPAQSAKAEPKPSEKHAPSGAEGAPESAKEAPKPAAAKAEDLTFEQPVQPPSHKGEKGDAPAGARPSDAGAASAGHAEGPSAKTPPKPAGKTPQDYVADLASPDAKVRLAAIKHFAEAPAPEALAPLADLVKKEDDGEALKSLGSALGGYDGALLVKQAPLKDAALNGSDAQKRTVVAAIKKAGTEAGVRFLVEQFVAKGEAAIRNDVASALKKHKKIAIKPLREFFAKSGARPDIQVEIIKYVGIVGESKQGATFLIALMEVKEVLNVVLHALRKIDKPVVPALIQVGLGGPSRTRMWSGWLLRGLTNQQFSSQNAGEWSKWWGLNRKGVEAEEAKWDKADEASNWAVDEIDWSEYDVEIVNNYYGTLWWWPWRYESSRGRPRGDNAWQQRVYRVVPGGLQIGGGQGGGAADGGGGVNK